MDRSSALGLRGSWDGRCLRCFDGPVVSSRAGWGGAGVSFQLRPLLRPAKAVAGCRTSENEEDEAAFGCELASMGSRPLPGGACHYFYDNTDFASSAWMAIVAETSMTA